MNFRFILILKTELLVCGREQENKHKVNWSETGNNVWLNHMLTQVRLKLFIIFCMWNTLATSAYV